MPEGTLKASGRLGKNSAGQIIKKLANRCSFDNANQFTGRAARRTGVTRMSQTDGVYQSTIKHMARHASTGINVVYQEPTQRTLLD